MGSKVKINSSSLLGSTHELLVQAIAAEFKSSRQIARDCNISPETLHRFRHGDGDKDMATDSVQRLYEYLSGNTLIGADDER